MPRTPCDRGLVRPSLFNLNTALFYLLLYLHLAWVVILSNTGLADMANKPIQDDMHGHVEELEPRSPGVDYGLSNDDGFDPAKYDFYNPSYRTASKAFVVRLDEYVGGLRRPPSLCPGHAESTVGSKQQPTPKSMTTLGLMPIPTKETAHPHYHL